MNEYDYKRREQDLDMILIGIDEWLIDSEREAFTLSDIEGILRKGPFYLEDPRTHRNKRRLLEDNGLIIRVNKVAYKLTEVAYARIRKAKGVPGAPVEDELPAHLRLSRPMTAKAYGGELR